MSAARNSLGPVGFVGRRGIVWSWIASWFIPMTMTFAYIVLALTAETDAAGWAWMGCGLVLVMVLWFMYRSLTRSAAMSRALAVGDADRVLELADDVVARRRGAVRAQFQLYRAIAFELRGDWPAAVRAVDAAALGSGALPSSRAIAVAIRIGALIETGDGARARMLLDAELAPLIGELDPRRDVYAKTLAQLARGRVLAAEHSTEAPAALGAVIDNVRSGAASRAIAHHYAARSATDRGDPAAAARHRARAAALAPGTWMAGT